jgi:hypothetical protein
MTLKQDGTSFRERVNNATANGIATKLQVAKMGDILRCMDVRKYGLVPAASPYNLATLLSVVLSDFAKASTIRRAYARAATAGTGELTIVAFGTTPTSGQIAVAPNGDIVTLAADAITLLDLEYNPRKHDTKEISLPVTSGGVLTLPAVDSTAGITEIFEAEVLTGSAAGKKIVLVPGSGGGSAGQCKLNVAKTTVTFGDAGASVNSYARVKYGVAPATDLDALLESTAVTP